MKNLLLAVFIIGLLFVIGGCTIEDDNNDIEVVKINNKTYEVKREEHWASINNQIFVNTGEYFDVNMTLVVSGNEATIIDTGDFIHEARRVKDYITENNLTLKNIFITHHHHHHYRQLDMFLTDDVALYEVEDTTNNQIITMGDMSFKIIHTAGHTYEGHMSILINNEILVAGDVILSTQWIHPILALNYGGDKETLIQTLNALNETKYSFIIPGHGQLSVGNDLIEENISKLTEDDS